MHLLNGVAISMCSFGKPLMKLPCRCVCVSGPANLSYGSCHSTLHPMAAWQTCVLPINCQLITIVIRQTNGNMLFLLCFQTNTHLAQSTHLHWFRSQKVLRYYICIETTFDGPGTGEREWRRWCGNAWRGGADY
jgi:hypothetical protein